SSTTRYIFFNQLNCNFCRARLKQWIRTCAFNRYFCNYFPVKLVKTTDLDPNKSYLFCNFPHGLICLGVYCAFGTDAAGFRELFPGLDINIIMLEQFFKAPFFRDYCRIYSVASSSAESVNLLLSTKPEARYSGRATVLIVGGAAEATESKPGTYRILIKRRKGFVRLSLKNGVSIVPVCSFGETNAYDKITFLKGSFMKKVMNFNCKILGFHPIFYIGWVLLQNYIIPRRIPITVVVGSPMDLPK
ncbi:diacylglycerol O-acyltransferase 2-like, partial [Frieseomelitta varia]|uniref:diacylglycerol O-acyltransferase 2-like n=1 Tax=Frieseomelitta varia TaxID=561572 RepID=UPI001CB6B412